MRELFVLGTISFISFVIGRATIKFDPNVIVIDVEDYLITCQVGVDITYSMTKYGYSKEQIEKLYCGENQ